MCNIVNFMTSLRSAKYHAKVYLQLLLAQAVVENFWATKKKYIVWLDVCKNRLTFFFILSSSGNLRALCVEKINPFYLFYYLELGRRSGKTIAVHYTYNNTSCRKEKFINKWPECWTNTKHFFKVIIYFFKYFLRGQGWGGGGR